MENILAMQRAKMILRLRQQLLPQQAQTAIKQVRRLATTALWHFGFACCLYTAVFWNTWTY